MCKKNILLVISPRGFCDEEYFVTRSILESSGMICNVASSNPISVVSMEGASVQPDIDLYAVKVENYDAICFIGGVGCTAYWHDKNVHNIIKKAHKYRILLAAICLAPVILANAGLLTGKYATAYPSARQYLKKRGVICSDRSVEVENDIVTARDPAAARAFALKICNELI
jgi:protease I